MFAVSCKSTRFVSDGNYLLSKQKVKIRNKEISPGAVGTNLVQKPNKKILGLFRNRLFFYNISHGGKERKVKTWIKDELASPPVIYDSLLMTRSMHNVKLFLENEGYYFSSVEVKKKKKGKKKIKLEYIVKTGEPFIIDKVRWYFKDSALDVKRIDTVWTNLRKGRRFRVPLLKDAQTHLRNLYQNRSYYDFDFEDVSFEADTFAREKKVNIDVVVYPKRKKQADTITYSPHKKHRINNVYIYTDFNYNKYLVKKEDYISALNRDTVESGEVFLYESDNIKRDIILRHNRLKKGKYYKLKDVVYTRSMLSDNKLFKQVSVSFTPSEETDSVDVLLDCHIRISQFTLQQLSINVQGTNTGGDVGAGINLTYRHRNVFRGAEALSVRVKTSQEIDQSLSTGEQRVFNSQEYGADVELEFPRFLLPLKMERFDAKYAPSTVTNAGYYFLQNLDYTSPRAFARFGYKWKASENSTHNFSLVDVSGVSYRETSDRFDNYLETNPYFKNSYQAYFISSTAYNYVYYDAKRGLNNSLYFSGKLEMAGNVLSMVNDALQTDTTRVGYYTILKNRFAQYAKTEIDCRYYWVFNDYNTSVFRAFVGCALPYGNSDVIPSLKQYYSGGSNSMRAWRIRSLGPGSFADTSNTSGIQYYQGDVKFELNYEHRFHLFWYLNGAVFVDIGNIWSLNYDLAESSRLLYGDTFLQSLAVGAGAGVRFDFSFFILRLDMAMKTRDPSIIEGTKWVWSNRGFSFDDSNFTLSVGYPF